MEALARPSAASPALHQLSLAVLGSLDTWMSDPALWALARLVEDADDDEVRFVPASVGAVLPLLQAAPARLSVAIEAITRFDLHEATEGLAVLIWQGNAMAVLGGAAMAAHPAVSETFTDLVLTHASDLTEPWQSDLYRTRLDPDFVPQSAPAAAERSVRWVGADAPAADFAVAGVEPWSEVFEPRDHLRLVIELATAGVVVRRLSKGSANAPVGWLPAWAPVVGPNARDARFRTRPGMSAADRRRLVETVLAVAPSSWRDRRTSGSRLTSPAPSITDIEVFDDGAMPRPEVAYLSGIRHSQFQALRRYPSLQPTMSRGSAYWTFSQVVGLRTAQYLLRISERKRGLGVVADKLVALSRERRQVPVAVTARGEILTKDEDVLYNIETGQVVEEQIISLADAVYEPFMIPGAKVPRLLQPSNGTAVHPGIVRGIPRVAGTRVTVGAVQQAVMAARAGRHDAPVEFAAQALGLETAQVRDAERVANEVRAAL